MRSHAKLKDVAREAGVNLSTASRSLSGSYGVHPKTRERVLEVAQRLGYRPNRVARGLATGRSHTFGLVISDIRNPFFAEVARGAEDLAYSHGCELVLCNSDLDPAKQMRYVTSLAEKRVDGILINSVESPDRKQQEDLASFGTPIVFLNRSLRGQPFSTVCADNFQGGQLAGEYLVAKGHRRIAHLTGPRQHGNLSDRTRGFLSAVSSAIVVYGHHTHSGGYEMGLKLLDEHPEVTAIFAANDTVAFGVLQAAIERGRRVPDDLSLVGFDNVEVSRVIQPPLTTIHQPKYEMGQAAMEILLRLSTARQEHVVEHRVLGVKLIERQSCRALTESER